MSFWNTSDNENLTSTDGNYESKGADLPPIPKDTGLLSAIEEAKWDDYEGDSYISLKWRVLKGEYQNRVLFQKLYVQGDSKAKDSMAKADKAKRMLAAIDANAGGKLLKLNIVPEDTDLMSALVGKMMAIKVQVWSFKDETSGETKSGNWISAVAPKGAGSAPVKSAPVKKEALTMNDDNFDSDIPF
jgi:hypothetical protein